MQKTLQQRIEQYAKKKRLRRYWTQALAVLSVCVALGTFCVFARPAIALVGEEILGEQVAESQTENSASSAASQDAASDSAASSQAADSSAASAADSAPASEASSEAASQADSPAAAALRTYTYSDAQATITVTVPENVMLPAQAKLVVAPLEAGTAAYDTAMESVNETAQGEPLQHVAYDIHFEVDGVPVEPQGGDVQVQFVFAEGLASNETDAQAKIYHVKNNGEVEDLPTDAQVDANGNVTQMDTTTGSFSTYIAGFYTTSDAKASAAPITLSDADVVYYDVYGNKLTSHPMVTASLPDGVTVSAGTKLKVTLQYNENTIVNDLKAILSSNSQIGIVKNQICGFNFIDSNNKIYNLDLQGQKVTFQITLQDGSELSQGENEDGEPLSVKLYTVKSASTVTSCEMQVVETSGTNAKKMSFAADASTLSDSPDFLFVSQYSTVSSKTMPLENYTLDYLLNNYNIVSLGADEAVTKSIHCMGAVMIQGAYNSGTSCLDAVGIYVPCVFGGKITHTGEQLANGRTTGTGHSAPVYAGSTNTVRTTWGGSLNEGCRQRIGNAYNQYGNIYTNDSYVDWDRMQAMMSQASQEMTNTCSGADAQVTLTTSGSPLSLDAGKCYTLTMDKPNAATTAKSILLQKITGENGGFDENSDPTIITILTSGAITLPAITNLTSSEWQKEGAFPIVWNCPNATSITVSSTSFYGHLLAPNADITIEGGNYNGCLIGRSMKISAEGHLWPYRSSKPPVPTQAKVSFQAIKTINDVPAGDEPFQFNLYELKNGAWSLASTKVQSMGSVDFAPVVYYAAGDYWYKIAEKATGYTDALQTSFKFSETVYLAHVVVTKDAESGNLDETTQYYCVKSSGEELKNGAVNAAALEERKEEQVVFNNITLLSQDAEIHGSKTLYGTNGAAKALSEGEYQFELVTQNAAGTGYDKVASPMLQNDSANPALNDANGAFGFLLHYDVGGDYTYYVHEVLPSGATAENKYTLGGVQYDNTYYKVVVHVSKEAVSYTYYDAAGKEISGTAPATPVMNREAKRLLLQKKWQDVDGSSLVGDTLNGLDEVSVRLYRTTNATRSENEESDKIGTTGAVITLNSANGWQWSGTISGKDDDLAQGCLAAVDANGKEYHYYAIEQNCPAGYFLLSATYADENGASVTGTLPVLLAGTVTITNQKTSYILPATGGRGVYPYLAIGLLLMSAAMAGTLYFRANRRRCAALAVRRCKI